MKRNAHVRADITGVSLSFPFFFADFSIFWRQCCLLAISIKNNFCSCSPHYWKFKIGIKIFQLLTFPRCLHSWCSINCIAKQTISRHFVANYPSNTWSYEKKMYNRDQKRKYKSNKKFAVIKQFRSRHMVFTRSLLNLVGKFEKKISPI